MYNFKAVQFWSNTPSWVAAPAQGIRRSTPATGRVSCVDFPHSPPHPIASIHLPIDFHISIPMLEICHMLVMFLSPLSCMSSLCCIPYFIIMFLYFILPLLSFLFYIVSFIICNISIYSWWYYRSYDYRKCLPWTRHQQLLQYIVQYTTIVCLYHVIYFLYFIIIQLYHQAIPLYYIASHQSDSRTHSASPKLLP